jgi:hypothetical protein
MLSDAFDEGKDNATHHPALRIKTLLLECVQLSPWESKEVDVICEIDLRPVTAWPSACKRASAAPGCPALTR